MSLYNMLFGSNLAADVILATLGLTQTAVGRFRDCYVTNGEIAVYTRNGSGNRECWQDERDDCECCGCIITHRLPNHPQYLRDVDDDYDGTYATIYFRFPDEYAEDLAKLDSGEEFNPSERWRKLIDSLEKSTTE